MTLTTSEASVQDRQPRVLHVSYERGRGLIVKASHSCGHQTENAFPHAKRRTSLAQLRQWLFGPVHDDEHGVCQSCRNKP